jgi:CheY-like chemotaxis protein
VLLRATPQLDDDDGGVELEVLIESEADSRPASMRELPVELGYRAAANLLAACGATLEVTRIAGLGARATIKLPAAPEPPAPAAPAAPAPPARSAPLLAAHPFGGVLIADGDAALRDMISSAVEASGRNVVVAPTGRHARELFLRTPERFELLVLEQDARQLAGDELALEALAHPAAAELRILLLGNGRDPTRADLLHPDRCARIDKPFGLMELRDALAVLIAPAERVR